MRAALVLVALLLPATVWADFVQSDMQWGTSGVVQVTLTGVGSGNCLVALVNTNAVARTFTVTDDQSNSYDEVPYNNVADATGDSIKIHVAVANNVAGGTTVISATPDALTPDTRLIVMEFSGCNLVTAVEDNALSEVEAVNAVNPGPITASAGSDLVAFVAFQVSAVGQTISAGSGWTADRGGPSSADAPRGFSQYRENVTAGSYDAGTITWDSTNRDVIAVILSLDAEGGASGPPVGGLGLVGAGR